LGEEGAGSEIGPHQKDTTAEEAEDDQGSMCGTDEHPDDVRDNQSDESDDADKRHGDSGEQGHDEGYHDP